MDLRNIFYSIKVNDKHLRVETKYNIDIYLGRDIGGSLSLVIIEKGKMEKFNSSNSIKVTLRERKDKKLALEFKLLDLKFENIFLVFCEDIIKNTENISKDIVISFCLKRWLFWKKMFSGTKKDFLSESKIKGLIGELLFLKESIQKYNHKIVIESWLGPLGNHKDFKFDKCWYEIKSISENAEVVDISSLEQLELEIDKEGTLIIYTLEKTNKLEQNTSNLNLIFSEIVHIITENDVLEEFYNKLILLLYIPDDYYNDFNYKIISKNSYNVNDDFPKITKNNISNNIVNVNYSINIRSIDKFKQGE